MNLRRLTLALASTLFAGAATLNATTISFQWTAVALPDSTLDGQAFSGDIIFSGTSDTALAQPNPIVTGGQNFGFSSVGPVNFFIPALNATGTTSDTAFILSFSGGLLKFDLSPNGVTADAGDLLFSNLTQTDLFNASQTVSGPQLVEARGTAPVLGGSLFLDTDPNQTATLVETVGAPEPATWTTLLAGALLLALWRCRLREQAARAEG
jgi:hypothetical protein